MKLYSYNGQEPKELPFKIRLDNGETRTSLSELSDEDLLSIGFVGPISIPLFDESTQKVEWNGNEYTILLLTEEEILQKQIELQRKELREVNYNEFWKRLIMTKFYKKLRIFASQSLEANTICTELISLFNDAKNKNANITAIQNYLNILFVTLQFTTQEVEELQKNMEENKLNLVYTLPDQSYIDGHIYDPISNTIIKNSPFESWILVDGKWQAPIEYPTDGKIYNWDETLGNWILLQ